RRLKRAAPGDHSRVRISVYRGAMMLQWTITAVILARWIARGRYWGPPTSGGLGLLPLMTPGFVGIGVGLVIVALVLMRERIAALRDDEALARVRAQIRTRGL